MSLFLAAGLEDGKGEEKGEDKIAKAIRGGKKESEMRLAALRERLEVLLNVCSLVRATRGFFFTLVRLERRSGD